MSINLLKPPARAVKAVRAYIDAGPPYLPAMAEASRLFVDCDDISLQKMPLCYPHVFVDVRNPDATFNGKPYAWQFIFGTRENPVSLEVGNATDGTKESVAVVTGPRLVQTVGAIIDTIRQYRNDRATSYSLKLLHLRSIAFRAVLLADKEGRPIIATPLEPFPESLLADMNAMMAGEAEAHRELALAGEALAEGEERVEFAREPAAGARALRFAGRNEARPQPTTQAEHLLAALGTIVS